MRVSRLELNLEDLTVESLTTSPETAQSQFYYAQIVYTVLYETEQISCGGTCRTCNCWA